MPRKSKIRRLSGSCPVNLNDATGLGRHTVESHNASNSAPIASKLPIELLTLIFEYVDPKNWKGTKPSEGESPEDTMLRITEKLKIRMEYLPPPFNFPYNLAGVCVLWRDVLSTKPEHWTELTFYVDSLHPTPIKVVKMFLEYSQDLPISVTVRRSKAASGDEVSDHEESRRTRAVMDALKPHVHRCTHINFKVLRGSSLPSLTRDLFDISPNLVHLDLQCETDDGYPSNLKEIGPIQLITRISRISHLCLQGYTLVDALLNASVFIFRAGRETLKSLNVGKLNVDNYRGARNLIPGLLSALSTTRKLSVCTLTEIEAPRSLYLVREIGFIPRTNVLVLRRLNKALMKIIIEHADMSATDCLQIQSCSLKGLSITGSQDLSLRDIDGDLLQPLLHWTGDDALFKNCPGFNDKLLDHFAGQVGPIALLHLHLVDCQDYTIEGLKRFCMTRLIISRSNGNGLRSLFVVGETPDISEIDGTILRASVLAEQGHFIWNSQNFAVPLTEAQILDSIPPSFLDSD